MQCRGIRCIHLESDGQLERGKFPNEQLQQSPPETLVSPAWDDTDAEQTDGICLKYGRGHADRITMLVKHILPAVII
jgi:hypothetical protein